MKKLIICASLALLTTGCEDQVQKQRDQVHQASTNAAYLQGQADAKVSFQQLASGIQGVQHDIRVLLTNQMLLNGRIMSLERWQKASTNTPATNAAPVAPIAVPETKP